MKRIGLVLSGGMGKGAYQIGALMAFGKFFEPSDFQYVSAASVGVLNTYAYLTNKLERASEIWRTYNPPKEEQFITSVIRSPFLQDVITEIATDSEIPNTFYVPLLDMSNKELNYYDFSEYSYEGIDPYLRASVALPFRNKGVTIGTKTLYDGAVVDNIPIYPVLKNELDYVICMYFDDFNYVFENYDADNRIIKLTFPDNKIISNSVRIRHESIMQMMEDGYDRTDKILSKIFENGTDNLPSIYEKIAEQNATTDRKRVRITGDVVVTNMNKITKRMLKRRQILEHA